MESKTFRLFVELKDMMRYQVLCIYVRIKLEDSTIFYLLSQLIEF